jgi:oligopeptide transport system ATP-binding protein
MSDAPRGATRSSTVPSRPVLEVVDLHVHYKVPVRLPPTKLIPRDLGGLARTLLLSQQEATLRAVDGITFDVPAGETLGLVGESGCGKSTTGRTIVMLEQPSKGSVYLDGIRATGARRRHRRRLRRRVQMVFQDPYASLDPRLPVGHIVGEPLRALGLERSAKRRAEQVVELLDKCGLDPSIVGRYPHEFSGGQRQRIAIARAIAPEPKLLIADEPVSALDVSIQAQIVNLLLDLKAQMGLSMLFIAHDLAVVRHVSERVAVMYLGKIVEVLSSAEIPKGARHPYTRALIEAVPVPDPKLQRARKLAVIEGEVPSPLSPPSGCRFHPRCPEVRERCRVDEPELKRGDLGGLVACHVAHNEA